MCEILGVSRLRKHNQSSLVITLTEPAEKLGLEEGDYLKIVGEESRLSLIPLRKALAESGDKDEQTKRKSRC